MSAELLEPEDAARTYDSWGAFGERLEQKGGRA